MLNGRHLYCTCSSIFIHASQQPVYQEEFEAGEEGDAGGGWTRLATLPCAEPYRITEHIITFKDSVGGTCSGGDESSWTGILMHRVNSHGSVGKGWSPLTHHKPKPV